MGSGYSGNYGGTKGASQPYADTYGVVKEQLNKDKADPDIYNPKTGYFKNPTAVSIESAIVNEGIHVGGHRQDGRITYVMNEKGQIILGVRNNPNDGRKRSPHPTLIGGKDPKVQCAGMIQFIKGKIYKVNTNSGHYKPNIKSLEKVEKALDELYKRKPEIFSSKSKWRKNK